MRELRYTPVGKTVEINGTTLRVERAVAPEGRIICYCCYFDNDAQHCPHFGDCIAAKRPDRESVIFTKVQQPKKQK